MDSAPGNPHHEVILQTAGLTAAIVLAEPTIFLSGFSRQEQQESSPALVRGSLILRITKPKKLKSITLNFNGVSRTEWPEGIPAEKSETHETKDVFSHEWRLFSVQQTLAATSSGAHSVVSLDAEHQLAPNIDTNGADPSGNPSNNNAGSGVSSTPHALVNQQEAVSKGYRVFNPAEYVYNFELMLPHTLPETMKCNFGTIRWGFNLEIDRHGKFKPKLNAYKEVTLLRKLGPSNLEISEPIVINRDWEDLLHYEIIIAGKAFAIGQRFNVGISLVRMAKVKCHRIRIYITEHTEYFCRNSRIHRVEPSHKFLLLEHKSPDGSRGDLLNSTPNGVSGLTEFEFDVEIPQSFPSRRDYLRPNASTENIKVYHWIKAVMRLSRQDLSVNGEPKCYEVSIDSPVTLVDAQTMLANELPDYHTAQVKRPMLNALKPYQKFIQEGGPMEGSTMPPSQRAILFTRKPSVAPPPFDADQQPPSLPPPQYDVSNEQFLNYRKRYEEYLEAKAPTTNPQLAGEDLAHVAGPTSALEPSAVAVAQASSYEPAEEAVWQRRRKPGDSETTSQNSENGSNSTVYSQPEEPEVVSVKEETPTDLFPIFSEIFWSEGHKEAGPDELVDPGDHGLYAELPMPQVSQSSQLTAQINASVPSSPKGTTKNTQDADLKDPREPAEDVAKAPAEDTARAPAGDAAKAPADEVPTTGTVPAVTVPEVSVPEVSSTSKPTAHSPVEGKSSPRAAHRVGSFSLQQRNQIQFQRLRNSITSNGSALASAGSSAAPPSSSSAGSGILPIPTPGSGFPARYPPAAQNRKLSLKTAQSPTGMSPRSPVAWPDTAGQQSLFGERWMDRRDSMNSIASTSRYFRQSSVVSMDLTRQGELAGRDSRRPSRVGEVQELREWYPLSRNNSDSSVAVSIAEYQLPDRQHVNSPLLRDDESEVDIGLEWEHDFEDYSGLDNDRGSVVSAFYTVMTP